MSDREKLIELLTASAPYALPSNVDDLHLLLLADELLSRGVTVQKHGRWEPETDEEEPNPMFKLVVCSNCGKKADDTYPYCPNCGAKMDEEASIE